MPAWRDRVARAEALLSRVSGTLDLRVHVVLAGLLLTMLLASVDNLVVGTAMPRIVGDLGGVEHLSWVVTAYLLTMTVSGPFYGRLGDLYGRKRLYMGAIVCFLVASALSGLSRNMAELIAFRALQGLGAGGMVVSALAIMSDLVAPRERGRLMGLAAPVISVATVGGPLLGGFLTDHLSWRWIFYINLPVGLVALALIGPALRLPHRRIRHRIDWPGAVLLIVAASALMLVRSWAGTRYAWGSWQVAGLAVTGLVSTLSFVLVERRAPEPMLPLRLFRVRNFDVAVVHGFLIAFALFGAVTFLPLYQQTVQGASATSSGVLLLPMVVPTLVVGPLVGLLISRTGRYKIFQILGGVILTAGMYLLTRLGVHTTRFAAGAYMVVFGVGTAMSMQLTMLIAQNSAEQPDMGVASSTSNFFRSLGGAFGVSLFGSVFTGRLHAAVAGTPGAGVLPRDGGVKLDPDALAKLPPSAKGPFLAAVADAVHGVFWWGLPFAALVVVAGWVLKEVPLRASPGRAPERLPHERPRAAA